MTILQKEDLIETARELAEKVLALNAASVDKERRFPEENFAALKKAGLMGLLVPKQYGGHEASFETFTSVMEVIGEACATTAMCYLMHNCGTAVMVRYAVGEQRERMLPPAGEGEKIATLAFSEAANGAHFYQPSIQAVRDGKNYLLNGKKSFVTNGSYADYYMVVTKAPDDMEGLNIFAVEKNTPNLSFSGEWDGIGMTGNSSIVMELKDAPVPGRNLIGKEGTGLDVIFADLVAPVFIPGLSAVNIGIARAAMNTAIEHTKNERTKMQIHPSEAIRRFKCIWLTCMLQLIQQVFI